MLCVVEKSKSFLSGYVILIQTKRPLSILGSGNDYMKKPLEFKKGFLVVYILLIYCVFESLAC